MSDPTPAGLRKGFCIFINTLCQGPGPLVSEHDRYVVFDTELEAQKEIVDNQMTRFSNFSTGSGNLEMPSKWRNTLWR